MTCPHKTLEPLTNEDLAERIGYMIQHLLTEKYGNSLKVAVGVIWQELDAHRAEVRVGETSREERQ